MPRRSKQLKPPGDQPLKHAPRIIPPTHSLQPLLALRAIPINNILAAIRVIKILVRNIQPPLPRRAFDDVEERDGGAGRQGVVGGVVPRAREEAVDEGALGGVEAEGVAAP